MHGTKMRPWQTLMVILTKRPRILFSSEQLRGKNGQKRNLRFIVNPTLIKNKLGVLLPVKGLGIFLPIKKWLGKEQTCQIPYKGNECENH